MALQRRLHGIDNGHGVGVDDFKGLPEPARLADVKELREPLHPRRRRVSVPERDLKGGGGRGLDTDAMWQMGPNPNRRSAAWRLTAPPSVSSSSTDGRSRRQRWDTRTPAAKWQSARDEKSSLAAWVERLPVPRRWKRRMETVRRKVSR
ncbi:unnamed protein product [Urochloa humidicola]